MDQIIQQSLAGRRFALMGFEPAEGTSILAALASVRGIGHVVGEVPSIPGLNTFSPFDACFINGSAPGIGEQAPPVELIARSRKPAVVIGTPDQLLQRFTAVADLNRDFMLRPYQAEELLLRAYRILRFAETAEFKIPATVRNGARRVLDAGTT